MTIAEFFVKLGLKGEDDTAKGVEKVDKSLQGVVSTGLAVKAGLAAMAFGLQKLMSKSSEAGAAINQFENSTGLSGKLLQQWQYAARQFNVESEDMTGSIKGVQDAMTDMLLGKGAPEGFGMVANMVDLDPTRVRDTYYVLEQLQEFAKQVPADVSKSMLKSFGISEGVIAAMRQNAFRPDVFQQAPIYTDKEVKQLRKVNVEWDNLYDKIDKSFGRLNAEHGEGLVSDISGVVDQVLKLTEALITLADKLHVFETIGKSIEGWSLIFGVAGEGVDSMSKDLTDLTSDEVYQSGDGETGAMAWIRDASLNDYNMIKSWFSDDVKMRSGSFVKPESVAKQGEAGATDNSNRSNNPTTINQTFNLKDSDPKAVGDSVKKATKDAFRQSPAQGQVN